MSMLNNCTEFIRTDDRGRKIFCERRRTSESRGIWFGENPFDNAYPLAMFQVILVAMTSQLLYYFLKPLGQTKFVCYLLGGIILGPSLIGFSKEFRHQIYGKNVQLPMFDTIAEIGTIYSIFLITVKFDILLLKKTAKNCWKIGLGGFLFPTIVTFSLIYPLTGVVPSFKWLLSTFSMSFTFFPVIAQALYELNLMSSELGQLAMSSAMLNDVLQWTSTAICLVTNQREFLRGMCTFLSLLSLVLFTVYVIRPLMLLIIKNTPEGKEVHEMYVVAIQLGVLIMSFASDNMGHFYIGGPIMMGLVIPEGPPLGATIVEKTELLVSEFLLPIFFFRIGTEVDVHAIGSWKNFTDLQSIFIVLYVSKIVGVTLAGLCCKLSFRNSFMLSMIMSMKGLIELNVWRHRRNIQMVDGHFFTQMVLSSLVLTMIVTPIVRFSYIPHMRLGGPNQDSLVRNIQMIPNDSGTFRTLCCVHNEENARNIITLLEASNPTDATPIHAYIIHTIDLVGHFAPQLTPYKKRSKLRRTDTPTNQMMRAFENYTENSKGPVVIEAYTMVAPYASMHETIFQLAQDNLVPLIIVPFHENHQSLVGSNMIGSIRQFNLNVLAHSPCSVGVLVDRGLGCRFNNSSSNSSNFSSIVAVFFIGGPDDREALAYASRMADNPDVCITVFRIIVSISKTEGKEEDETELKLDERLIDEFKVRNLGNDRLSWHDIEVVDCVEVMNVIKNSQGEYDLVMVGRRHADMSLRDEDMIDFMQNPELGMIGDVLASSDFCDGMVSVLVVQESRELGYGAYCNDSINCSGILV